MKNTHLEHLEDNILNGGSEGGKEAVAFLRSLGQDVRSRSGADARVTVKWDGAPAIVCGSQSRQRKIFCWYKICIQCSKSKNYHTRRMM